MGSETKTALMMLGSAAAAGVSGGAVGGFEPAPGLPQLKRPPLPVTLTAPTGQLGTGVPAPELPQSWLPAGLPAQRSLPSMLSQVEGAARAGCAMTVAAAAASSQAAPCLRIVTRAPCYGTTGRNGTPPALIASAPVPNRFTRVPEEP